MSLKEQLAECRTGWYQRRGMIVTIVSDGSRKPSAGKALPICA